nr:hypothetical protein [Hassalia byssoidea]
MAVTFLCYKQMLRDRFHATPKTTILSALNPSLFKNYISLPIMK